MEDASKTIDINKIYLWRRFLARWIDWYIVKTIYVGLLDPNSWVIEYNNPVAMTMGGAIYVGFFRNWATSELGLYTRKISLGNKSKAQR